MRLTVRLSTAAEAGFLSMPVLPSPAEDYTGPDGSLLEAKARRDLRDVPGVDFSGGDDAPVIGFAVELLGRLRVAFADLSGKSSGPEAARRPGRAEERYRKGRFAYVRIDLARKRGKVRVRVSASNPKGVVGHAENFAKAFAQVVADNLEALREDLGPVRSQVLEYEDGEGCEGLFERARRRVALHGALAKRRTCPNRTADFCTPAVPECPCYRSGKCGKPKGGEDDKD